MEWTNSDVPGDESPHCPFCGKQIGIGCEAIALRTGAIKTTGRMYEFCPSLFDNGEDVLWFHFSCLETVLDFCDVTDEDDATDCAFCPEDLLGEETCYELELGEFEINGEDTWWIETRNDEGDLILASICTECLEAAVGEGSGEDMRQRLGMKPEAPSKRTALPPHMRVSGRRPPAQG